MKNLVTKDKQLVAYIINLQYKNPRSRNSKSKKSARDLVNYKPSDMEDFQKNKLFLPLIGLSKSLEDSTGANTNNSIRFNQNKHTIDNRDYFEKPKDFYIKQTNLRQLHTVDEGIEHSTLVDNLNYYDTDSGEKIEKNRLVLPLLNNNSLKVKNRNNSNYNTALLDSAIDKSKVKNSIYMTDVCFDGKKVFYKF